MYAMFVLIYLLYKYLETVGRFYVIENNCKKFMIISSSSEFGEININTNGVKRNDFKFPNDSYGLSKLVFNNIAPILT